MKAEIIPGLNREHSSPDDIVALAAYQYGLKPEVIKGRSRLLKICESRYYAMYLLRKRTDLTLDEIGKMLNRDHSTALYGVRVIEDRISVNQMLVEISKDVIKK